MPPSNGIPPELDYVILLFALFVLPRVLQRYRLPATVTSVALGAIAGPGWGLFPQDRTVALFAVLGIVSLFLFAGLELDFAEVRQGARILAQHLGLGVAALFGIAGVIRGSLEPSLAPGDSGRSRAAHAIYRLHPQFPGLAAPHSPRPILGQVPGGGD